MNWKQMSVLVTRGNGFLRKEVSRTQPGLDDGLVLVEKVINRQGTLAHAVLRVTAEQVVAPPVSDLTPEPPCFALPSAIGEFGGQGAESSSFAPVILLSTRSVG